MAVFDPVAESVSLLGERAGCWEFIRKFAAAWHEPLGHTDGDGLQAISAVEKRLDVPLPAAVYEAYELFGRRDDLTRNQDELHRLDELDLWHGEFSVLVFREESQGCWQWGIRLADLHLDDPAVMLQADNLGWVRYQERFSLAAVDLVMSETMVSKGSHLAMSDYDVATIKQLTQRYAPLALPASPVGVDRAEVTVRWYGGPDVILRVDGNAYVWACGRTAEALTEVIERLPGSWYHHS